MYRHACAVHEEAFKVGHELQHPHVVMSHLLYAMALHNGPQ